MTPYMLASLTTALGIRSGYKLSLINPPPGFVHRLNPLPDGVEFLVTARSGLDLVLFFATSHRELIERLPAIARTINEQGGIWVCWPSPVALQSALSEETVRRSALDLGLVDNKICYIDSVWTGLRLVRRGRPRPDKPERRHRPHLAEA